MPRASLTFPGLGSFAQRNSKHRGFQFLIRRASGDFTYSLHAGSLYASLGPVFLCPLAILRLRPQPSSRIFEAWHATNVRFGCWLKRLGLGFLVFQLSLEYDDKLGFDGNCDCFGLELSLPDSRCLEIKLPINPSRPCTDVGIDSWRSCGPVCSMAVPGGRAPLRASSWTGAKFDLANIDGKKGPALFGLLSSFLRVPSDNMIHHTILDFGLMKKKLATHGSVLKS